MPVNNMSVLCQETDLPDFLLSNSSLTLLSIFAQPFVLVYVKYIDSSWALQLPNLIELNFLFNKICIQTRAVQAITIVRSLNRSLISSLSPVLGSNGLK